MKNLRSINETLARVNRPDLYADMFAEQLSFVTDESPLVDAVCSRRAGKTWGARAKISKTCQE